MRIRDKAKHWKQGIPWHSVYLPWYLKPNACSDNAPSRHTRNCSGSTGAFFPGSLVLALCRKGLGWRMPQGSVWRTAAKLPPVSLPLNPCSLFRRALSPDESRALASTAREAAGPDAAFDDGIRALVTALLVDPRFLLRVESARTPGARRPLDGGELGRRRR